MDELVTRRLVEMTFALPDEVAQWLARLGMAVDRSGTGVVRIRNPYLKITTAFVAGSDPTTRAACLGFAIAGSHWTCLFPHLLDMVNREWRSRRRSVETSRKDLARPDTGRRKAARQRPPPLNKPTFADKYKKQDPGSS
jgi:hypothetical protein